MIGMFARAGFDLEPVVIIRAVIISMSNFKFSEGPRENYFPSVFAS